MLYVDVKFANLLGPHLRNYKRKGDYLWNFSCPICGDSTTNKSKARGYIYKMKTALFVKCHKCGYSTNLNNFIKTIDPNLHREYALEKFKENQAPKPVQKRQPVDLDLFKTAAPAKAEVVDSVLDPIKRIDQLADTHPAVRYAVKRKIPVDKWSLLYFAPKFKKYVNSLIPNKFSDLENDHPRLIIPYFNSHGKCFAFQGRAFGKEEPKYFTIKLDDQEEKIYGLDRVDFSKRVYVVEGPLDSLFIPNAIAVSGSSFGSLTIKALQSNCIVVYDNEPRSKTLTKLIEQTIEQGYAVCMWPDTVEEKDINDMVRAGKTPQEIVDTIDNNTFKGVEAKLRFALWRKC